MSHDAIAAAIVFAAYIALLARQGIAWNWRQVRVPLRPPRNVRA